MKVFKGLKTIDKLIEKMGKPDSPDSEIETFKNPGGKIIKKSLYFTVRAVRFYNYEI
jgi:hypothetical protein